MKLLQKEINEQKLSNNEINGKIKTKMELDVVKVPTEEDHGNSTCEFNK